MDNKTEKQRYIEDLTIKIANAANSKRFVESEDGGYVMQYLAELISSKTNQLIGKARPYEEYLTIRAEIDILRKVRAILEAQGSETVLADLQSRINLVEAE